MGLEVSLMGQKVSLMGLGVVLRAILWSWRSRYGSGGLTYGVSTSLIALEISLWGWRSRYGAGDPPFPSQPPNLWGRPTDTYVIKLFDRSVDLGQFSEGTPLYPVCRAWMRNCPTGRPQICPTAPESAPHLQV